MDKKDEIKTESLVKRDNPSKQPNVLELNPNAGFHVELFGLTWKIGKVKMLVNESWVELNGLVPYDEEGDPVMVSLNRLEDMYLQTLHISPSSQVESRPVVEREVLLSPKEQMEMNFQPNIGKELFGGNAAADIEIGSNKSTDSSEEDPSTDNPVDMKNIQDNSSFSDDDKNRRNPTELKEIATPQEAEIFSSEIVMDEDIHREISVLENIKIRLTNEEFLSEAVNKNDTELSFNIISPLAMKIQTGCNKCQCGQYGGIPSSDSKLRESITSQPSSIEYSIEFPEIGTYL